jgi:hypothetical protein
MATKPSVAKKEVAKRKKRPAYKHVICDGTCSSVSDAYSALEELGSECREIVDNAPEGLNQTQRITTFEETADALEGVSEPDVPSCISDLHINYSEAVPNNKRASTSRSVRCSNAAAVFSAAADASNEQLEKDRVLWAARKVWDDLDVDMQAEQTEPDSPMIDEDDEGDVEQFANDCEEIASTVESLEFPGMFG